jgi:hypothetical protein
LRTDIGDLSAPTVAATAARPRVVASIDQRFRDSGARCSIFRTVRFAHENRSCM